LLPDQLRRRPQHRHRARVDPANERVHDEADEDVDEVAAVLGDDARGVRVLVDDRLEEGVESRSRKMRSRRATRPVTRSTRRPAALGKKSSAEKLAIMSMASSIEHVLEPLPVREPLGAVDVPERHRADDAVGEPEDVVVQRHRRRARRPRP
jgi:hypothetical protein